MLTAGKIEVEKIGHGHFWRAACSERSPNGFAIRYLLFAAVFGQCPAALHRTETLALLHSNAIDGTIRGGPSELTLTRLFLSVVLSCGILSGCSAHLTRSNAKAQLDAHLKQAQSSFGRESLTSQVGTVSGACFDSPNYDPVENNEDTAVLVAAGFITMRPIRPHVWDVALTPSGNQAVSAKYAHTQKPDCDKWQVTFALSRYDHVEVTGILEEGIHARVDADLTYAITPVGLATRRVASSVVLEVDKRKFGERVASEHLDQTVSTMLGDLAYLPKGATSYVVPRHYPFEKFDDGWKLDLK